jgi:hypothetical protein
MNAPIIDFETGQPIRLGYLEFMVALAHERRLRSANDDSLLRYFPMLGGD